MKRQAPAVHPGHRAPWLEGCRDQPLVDEALANDDIGLVEGAFDRAALHVFTEGQVGAKLRIEERRVSLQGALHIGDHRKRIELHLDQFQGIARLRQRFRDHHGDRFANVPDAVAREHATLRQGHSLDALFNLERLEVLKIRGRPHRRHALGLPRRGEVDAPDGGVCEITPRKHEVQASVGLEVVDIMPSAANQVRIFDAADRRTENRRRHSDEVYVYPRRAMGRADGATPELLPRNTWHADGSLRGLLATWLPPKTLASAEASLIEMGRAAGDELQRWGDACEQQPAFLRAFDGWGARVDEVVYPQAWRRLAASAASSGLVAVPYEAESLARFGADARLVQAALCYLFAPGTATFLCPVAMTDGAARVLADVGTEPQRAVLAHLVTRDSAEAWTSGQWMTERQGGSDVGSNAVVAKRDGDGWRLFGRKFFCSNIGSEVALALARPEGGAAGTRGLALFLVRRDLPDGSGNRYRIDRLKDKLGTRAMATGEVTLEGAHAELVGEAERGFAQMTAMLNITRLHNAITAAAIMRRAVMLAGAYAAQREAFGRRLDAQPLHREVLAEMAAEADGALYLMMRMAQLLGRIEAGSADVAEFALFRVGMALAKLYTAKQAVAVTSEAIECFGGQGYMEDTGLPRLLRDAQVLPIWEGTTSVLSLDVLRVLRKSELVEAVAAELVRLDAPERDCALDLVKTTLGDEGAAAEGAARRLAFTLAQAWMAGLLREAGREVSLRAVGLPLR